MTVNLRYNKTRKDVLKTSRVRSDMASLSGWVSEERMGISGMRLEFFSLIQMETLIMLPRRYCNDACRQYINRKFDIHWYNTWNTPPPPPTTTTTNPHYRPPLPSPTPSRFLFGSTDPGLGAQSYKYHESKAMGAVRLSRLKYSLRSNRTTGWSYTRQYEGKATFSFLLT